MDESTRLERILTSARQRLTALADAPPLDEEAVRRRLEELPQQHPEADASAWEGELERQVLLALEDVLTPGQWLAVMGSAPFGDGEGEPVLPLFDPLLSAREAAEEGAEDPAAMRTARGLSGLELLDAVCQAPEDSPGATVDVGLDADIGTYGAALWPALAQQGSGAMAPLGALSGAMFPSAADAENSDTRRLNRSRRAPGGVESHRPLGPVGACFPEAAASRRPVGEPPDQDLAALPDAMLDDLTD